MNPLLVRVGLDCLGVVALDSLQSIDKVELLHLASGAHVGIKQKADLAFCVEALEPPKLSEELEGVLHWQCIHLLLADLPQLLVYVRYVTVECLQNVDTNVVRFDVRILPPSLLLEQSLDLRNGHLLSLLPIQHRKYLLGIVLSHLIALEGPDGLFELIKFDGVLREALLHVGLEPLVNPRMPLPKGLLKHVQLHVELHHDCFVLSLLLAD